jgi:hypothetical protein
MSDPEELEEGQFSKPEIVGFDALVPDIVLGPWARPQHAVHVSGTVN